jgi:hypothetical protein
MSANESQHMSESEEPSGQKVTRRERNRASKRVHAQSPRGELLGRHWGKGFHGCDVHRHDSDISVSRWEHAHHALRHRFRSEHNEG